MRTRVLANTREKSERSTLSAADWERARITSYNVCYTKLLRMAVAVAKLGQQPRHLLPDTLRLGIQHGGVQVALQRHPLADPLPGRCQIRGPVQPQGIAAGLGHGFQPLSPILGEP